MSERPAFIHEDFLLATPSARRLYHEFAAPEPIIDYHCHLSPRDIAENRLVGPMIRNICYGNASKYLPAK
jgi:glucuronate isomerase